MSPRFAYDVTYDPPAPVVPLRVSPPGNGAGALVSGLVDSGADCSLVPPSLAHALSLPQVGRVEVRGVGGGGGSAPAYAGRVDVGRTTAFARLVAFGDEVIVGRDLLNRITAVLVGPSHELEVVDP